MTVAGRSLTAGLILALAGAVSGTVSPDGRPVPTPRSTLTGPAAGTVVWRADHAEGDLGDWFDRSSSASGPGGGEYNSGGGDAFASLGAARAGSYGALLNLPTGSGGTRLFRWQELRRHRRVTTTAWFFIPRNTTLTGDAATGRYWILNEFKSASAGGARNDPFWYVNAYRGRGGLRARLAWGYQSRLEGPRRGQAGWRNFGDVPIPVGRWFEMRMTIKQSSGFAGAIRVTVDGRTLADLEKIRTGRRSCSYNAWCVDQSWAPTSYSDGLSPAPAQVYLDDAAIAVP